MLAILRFAGIINVAVWFGSAVFFSFGAGPSMFSQDMKELLGGAYPVYSGAIAQIVLKRYFYLQNACAFIALAHLVVMAFYTGRPFDRLHVVLVSALLALGLLGGAWLQPKLKQLHVTKYSARFSQVERAEAGRWFSIWHGVSQTANLAMMGGVLLYLYRVTRQEPLARYGTNPNYVSQRVG